MTHSQGRWREESFIPPPPLRCACIYLWSFTEAWHWVALTIRFMRYLPRRNDEIIQTQYYLGNLGSGRSVTIIKNCHLDIIVIRHNCHLGLYLNYRENPRHPAIYNPVDRDWWLVPINIEHWDLCLIGCILRRKWGFSSSYSGFSKADDFDL